jgi:protein-tyrosine kinase
LSENYELLCASKDALELFERQLPTGPGGNGHVKEWLDDNRRVRDEVLKLIERVFLTDGSLAPRIVAFSSVESGAGSTWICAHVGKELVTQIEGTVCMIDFNPHSQSLHRYFEIDAAASPVVHAMPHMPGEDGAYPVQGNDLWLLSGSPIIRSDAGSKNLSRLKANLSKLCRKFHYVLLDLPPVNDSADALTLGRLTDGMILVLAAHSTHKAAALRAKQNLDALDIKLLGAVLNRRTFPIPQSIYSRL